LIIGLPSQKVKVHLPGATPFQLAPPRHGYDGRVALDVRATARRQRARQQLERFFRKSETVRRIEENDVEPRSRVAQEF
jgi:hypothetical protein